MLKKTTFNELPLHTPLKNAINDLGFTTPTPIQLQAFNKITSGSDLVGIAQTGTGKTFAYLLPILKVLPFSKQNNPRVLIIVPTRELVLQVVEEVKKLSKYINNRVLGVYGGTNINIQKKEIANGLDILVATPGRLYDLALTRVLQLKAIQKLVLDEVDVLLDFGFKHQLINIFDLLPKKRQNILFSATMTEDVSALIADFFYNPQRISIAVSGTPLKNIAQQKYFVPNFNTKVNLLEKLLENDAVFTKVLVFISQKKLADTLHEKFDAFLHKNVGVIHANKTQNYRLQAIKKFQDGDYRVLITTDVMARGLDISSISHVVNFDTPIFPENYMHRIGRTGRAKKKGNSIILVTEKEKEALRQIESLMHMQITTCSIPDEVQISTELIAAEKPKVLEHYNPVKQDIDKGNAFHEKKDKNKKENLGGSYKYKIAAKYKKPKTRGDKNYNKKNKRK